MTDINQQEVFDRLPLTAEQRKKLYAAITDAESRREIAIPVNSSAAPDSPVELNRSPDHPADSPVS